MRPVVRPRTAHAIIALGITQIIGWGTTFYLPAIMARPIAESLDLSPISVLGAYSWALLVSGLLSRRIGRLIDRFGAARPLAAASAMAATALALHAVADGLALIWLAWTIIGLGMRAILYDGAFAALTALEGPGARRAISLLTLLGGLASTVFWPIGQALLEALGWRATLGVYAALNLLVCMPLHYRFSGSVASGSPERHDPKRPAPPPVSPDSERAVTLIATAFALHAFIWSSLAVHLPQLLKAFSLGTSAAVAVAAMMGPAQVVARSAELFAQRWLSPVALAVPVFGLLPLSLATLALPLRPELAAVVFVLIYGSSNGLLTILRGALPLTIIGPRGYGELLGRIAAPSLIVSAVSPLVFGVVLEAFGADAAWLLFAAGIACTLAAVLLVRHARTRMNRLGDSPP